MNKFTNPYLGVLILKKPTRYFSHSLTIVKEGRAHKKARWATYMDTTTMDTTMDTTLLAKLLSAILLDTTLSVKLLDLPRPRRPSTTTWRG